MPSSVLANCAHVGVPTRLSVMRRTPRTTLLPIDIEVLRFVPGSNKRVASHFLAYQIYLCQENSRLEPRICGLVAASTTFQRLQRRFTCWVISKLLGGFSSTPRVWRISWIT